MPKPNKNNAIQQSELLVLSCAIKYQEQLPLILTEVSDGDFTVFGNAVAYRAIRDTFQHKGEATIPEVCMRLADGGLLDNVGGTPFFDETLKRTASHRHEWKAAHRVMVLNKRRNTIIERLHAAIEELGMAESIDDVILAVDGVAGDIRNALSKKMLSSAAELYPAVEEHVRRIAEHHNTLIGLSTGIDWIDKRIYGLMRGNLIFVAGRPGSGKSQLASQIAWTVAKRGTNTLVCSGEMIPEHLLARMLSCHAKTNLMWPTEAALPKLQAIREVVEGVPLYFTRPESGISIESIDMQLRYLDAVGKHAEFVVVDYLQLIRAGFVSTSHDRSSQIKAISDGLKALTMRHDTCMMVLTQLTKSVEREQRDPNLADLMEGGEASPDVVLSVTRPVDSMQPSTLSLLKERMTGNTGRTPMLWCPVKRELYIEDEAVSPREFDPIDLNGVNFGEHAQGSDSDDAFDADDIIDII